MAIRDWPLDERPREKLLAMGPAALSDAELLAIFLRTGVAGKSAVDLARELLTDFGGVRNLLNAERRPFCQMPGLGSAKYAQLQAVMEMARRHLGESLKRSDSLSSPRVASEYLRARLRDQPREVFACLFLDTRHRLITYEELFFGSIDSASVYPREVLRRVLAHNAAAVIFAHNHPSGDAQPSAADITLTRKLAEALALIDVRVLDHFVVGDDEPVSLQERGGW